MTIALAVILAVIAAGIIAGAVKSSSIQADAREAERIRNLVR